MRAGEKRRVRLTAEEEFSIVKDRRVGRRDRRAESGTEMGRSSATGIVAVNRIFQNRRCYRQPNWTRRRHFCHWVTVHLAWVSSTISLFLPLDEASPCRASITF